MNFLEKCFRETFCMWENKVVFSKFNGKGLPPENITWDEAVSLYPI